MGCRQMLDWGRWGTWQVHTAVWNHDHLLEHNFSFRLEAEAQSYAALCRGTYGDSLVTLTVTRLA